MASKTRVQMCAILEPQLLEFLYKLVPVHLVYTIAMPVCEKS